MGQLDGRIAVVTGGGRGIGRAIALRYAREGATVIVSARTKSDLEDVVTQMQHDGGDGRAVVADAMNRDDAREPVRAALREFGRLDILVNNVGGSGGSRHDPFEGDDETFENTVALNLTSAFWTTREALPAMRTQRYGRIVNIGSGASKHSGANLAYVAAKHGLAGYTKQLAAAAAPHGITVNLLCPGWTATSLIDWDVIGRARGISADEAKAWASSFALQNRVLEPEELTGMATLLVAGDGLGITGQVISVDGGYKV